MPLFLYHSRSLFIRREKRGRVLGDILYCETGGIIDGLDRAVK